MPTRGVAYSFSRGLYDAAAPGHFRVNPTIAPGDFLLSQDNGPFVPLTLLPVVTPAGSSLVVFQLTAAEMTADRLAVWGRDQAGGEWTEVLEHILPTPVAGPAPPVRGMAYSLSRGLYDAAAPGRFRVNPTIAAGDFTLSKDNGPFLPLTILPSVQPPASPLVMFQLTAGEMSAVRLALRGVDQAGGEWTELLEHLEPAPVVVPGPGLAVGTQTVRDLIQVAFLKLGILAEGEPLSAAQAAQGLRCLNSLLDAWALERLLVYVIDRQTFATVAGTQAYTLGPGGVWNTTPLYGAGTPRPVAIQSAWWQDTYGNELPLDVLDDQAYQSLTVRTLASMQALALKYDADFPLGKVFLWPKPSSVATIVLYLWRPWNAAQTLDTALSFPPGYQRLLEFNLAVELSSEYPGTLRPELAVLASEAKAKVQVPNLRIARLRSDLVGVTGHRGEAGLYSAWPSWLAGRG